MHAELTQALDDKSGILAPDETQRGDAASAEALGGNEFGQCVLETESRLHVAAETSASQRLVRDGHGDEGKSSVLSPPRWPGAWEVSGDAGLSILKLGDSQANQESWSLRAEARLHQSGRPWEGV